MKWYPNHVGGHTSTRYIQTLVAGVSPGGKRWVGMNDQFTERDWQWANHTQVSDTSFMLSQWHAYPDHTTDAPCPARWTSKASDDQTVCYYISTPQDNKATWQEARYKCQELAGVPDAHLVAIDSQDELDYLLTIVQKQPWAQYWTDLTDSSIEGYWQFSVSYMGTPPPIFLQMEMLQRK
nr:hypothetical protein BaRGS_031019 [Batillaria attramentaria]